MDDLTPEAIAVLEDMIQRRIDSTGESRDEACFQINRYLIRRAAGLTDELPN